MIPKGVPRPHRSAAPLLIIAFLAAVVPCAAFAQQDAATTRATALARAGRCSEALDVLSGVSPASASVLFLRGRCHLELKQFPAAVTALNDAKQQDPNHPEVDLHLGMALYQLGDLAGAESALDAAAATAEDKAEYHLYRGLIQLQKSQSSAAARSLDRARQISLAVEPTASYYAGLAYATDQKTEEALEALDRVIELAPGSVWAQEAERAKKRMQTTEPGRWWAWAKAGIEYDDNVVLRSQGTVLPENISGSHDARSVWTIHGGYEFLRERDWSAGVSLTYYGSAHFDLEDFNQHSPVVSLWVDHRLATPTTLRLRYDMGHAWVDGQPFQHSQTLTPTLFHSWGEAGRSKLFGSIYKYNYLYADSGDVVDGRGRPFSSCLSPTTTFCGPPGIEEGRDRNQDGWGFTLGADHTVPLGFFETELTGGYRYTRYSSRGSEYSHQAHEFRVGTESLLPMDLHLRTEISYAYRPYRNNSSYPNPSDVFFNLEYPLQNERRRDDLWIFSVELEKYLTDSLSAEIAYRYIKNHSNVTVFDYDREILGFYVTYRLEE